MELHELIWSRLQREEELTKNLVSFCGEPAVFTPEAPTDTAAGWNGKAQYPRIVFALDLSANEERKCQGSMILSIYGENDGTFDFNQAVKQITGCLCNAILIPENGNPYCLAWSRTDGFVLEGTNICGQEMQFDVLEYPNQETTDPDPADAVNAFCKGLFPEALVLWFDRPGKEEQITPQRPVIYCRIEILSEDQSRSTFGVGWLECSLAIHIFSTDANLRGKYARAIMQEVVTEGEIPMLDGSPFLVTAVSQELAADYLRTGQVKITGRFGVLRQREKGKRMQKVYADYEIGGSM